MSSFLPQFPKLHEKLGSSVYYRYFVLLIHPPVCLGRFHIFLFLCSHPLVVSEYTQASLKKPLLWCEARARAWSSCVCSTLNCSSLVSSFACNVLIRSKSSRYNSSSCPPCCCSSLGEFCLARFALSFRLFGLGFGMAR